MISYEGFRTGTGCMVGKHDGNGKISRLPPYNHIVNHSPDGFEWGYGGSGPAQLAFAILYDFTDNSELSKKLHQKFKNEFIRDLHVDKWSISAEAIEEWLEENAE